MVFLILALLLLIHHIYIHGDKSGIDRIFQFDDVNNHETVILFLVGMHLGSC
jgi:hypothetical protein